MDEQRNITSVVNQVERQLRREVISVRGNAAMQRERYLEYLRDLRKARWSKDYSRAGWIIEDLRTFVAEATRLQRKGRGAYRRLAGLAAQRGFAAPGETPALAPDPRFARANGDEAETSPEGAESTDGS